jgi:hypothetical protein
MGAFRSRFRRKRKRDAERLAKLQASSSELAANTTGQDGDVSAQICDVRVGQNDAGSEQSHIQTGDLGDRAGARGSGAEYDRRNASGRSVIQDARLMNRAIREQWIGNGPWPLDATAAQFSETREKRDLTLMEQTAAAVIHDLDSHDPRIRQIAVRSAVAMRGQNLADLHHLERMEYHERALSARLGLPGSITQVNVNMPGKDSGDNPGTEVYLPHNSRDPLPAKGKLGVSIYLSDKLPDEVQLEEPPTQDVGP